MRSPDGAYDPLIGKITRKESMSPLNTCHVDIGTIYAGTGISGGANI